MQIDHLFNHYDNFDTPTQRCECFGEKKRFSGIRKFHSLRESKTASLLVTA